MNKNEMVKRETVFSKDVCAYGFMGQILFISLVLVKVCINRFLGEIVLGLF